MSKFPSAVKSLIPGAVLGVSALLLSTTLVGSSADADNIGCGITVGNYDKRIFHGVLSLGPAAVPMEVHFAGNVATTTVQLEQDEYRESQGPYRVTAGHIEWDARDPFTDTPVVYSSRERACDGTLSGNPTKIEGLVQPKSGQIYDWFSVVRELPNG